MIIAVAVIIMADMQFSEKYFIVIHQRVTVFQVRFAGAQRLDLRAGQDHSGFVNIRYLIVAARRLVGSNQFLCCIFFSHS